MSLSVPGAHRGHHSTFSGPVLRLLLAVAVSQTSLVFFCYLNTFRSIGEIFCWVSLNWYFSDTFLMTRLGLWVEGGRYPR